MAQKITCRDLQKLLAKHLKGTAVEPLAKHKNYVTGLDGFVATSTINNLCKTIQQIIQVQSRPNPFRKPEVAQHLVAMQSAIEALEPFQETE